MKILKTVAVIALAAAAIYFAPELAGFATGLLGTSVSAASLIAINGAIASTIATIGIGVALAGAASLVSQIFAAKPNTGGATPTSFRQTITNSQIIYGTARVGGLITFYHANKQGGTDYRYFVITFAGHACSGVTGWYLNDELVSVGATGLVTSGKYANNAWLWAELGAVPAVSNATFVAETDGMWTAAHRGDGITKIYAKFKLIDAIIAENFPNITAVVAGKNDILDPRTGVRGFVNNAILCAYDWLQTLRADGGFGVTADEIDDDFVSAQANVCDEAVALKAGGTEPRYTCDGIITTGAEPAGIRDTLLTAFAGEYTYSGGLHYFYPGVWRPPTTTLAEADLVQPLQVAPLASGDTIADEVLGTFNDPAQNYQPQEYPGRSLPTANDLQINLDLPFTKSNTMAQRISKITLLRTAGERTVSWAMNIRGVATRALDIVQAATPRFGISNYTWKIMNWSIGADFSVSLGLKEESPDFYDWNPAVDELTPVVTAAAITAPVAFNVGNGTAPTALAVTEVSTTSATVSFTLPATSTIAGYDVFFQTSASFSGVVTRSGSATAEDGVSEIFTGLTTGTTYHAWARARLSTGAVSPIAGPVAVTLA